VIVSLRQAWLIASRPASDNDSRLGAQANAHERFREVFSYPSRAGWVSRQSCDVLRAGVAGVGGIGPVMKVAHLAESFGMGCEVHGNGAPNLAVVGPISNCSWYERGLLHPFLEYDDVPAYLNSIVDPMDDQGYAHQPQRPDLGEDINFVYIEANTLSRH
jgi:L-alanine-DL-glutamate epimerase-like enolase superfamily enzyme